MANPLFGTRLPTRYIVRLGPFCANVTLSPQGPGATIGTDRIEPVGRLESRRHGSAKAWNRKRIAKVAILAILGVLGLFVLYLILLCHPGLFFRYAFTHDGITLYSDEPIPASARQVLEDTEKRLVRSPFFRDRSTGDIRIYLCNRKWRFILFANYRYRVGGLTYPPLSKNIFLRGAHIDANRLIGPSGKRGAGRADAQLLLRARGDSYARLRRAGACPALEAPDLEERGLCGLHRQGDGFRLRARGRPAPNRRSRDESEELRASISRYHLLVAYLLDKKGISVHEMLDQAFDPAELEREILKKGLDSAPRLPGLGASVVRSRSASAALGESRLELLDDRAKPIIQPVECSIADLGRDPAVICLGDPAGDAGERVGVAPERDRQADRMLVVVGFEERQDGRRHGPPAGDVELEARPDVIDPRVQAIAEFPLEVVADPLLVAAGAGQEDGGGRRLGPLIASG